ncbi:MAG: plasmid pRiA4b ORF-3 family protein [Gammaproteobacteria bacterium]
MQFKITLQDIQPPIWRCIQLSDLCTFWDLHVAIQDAMGWTDTHLHHFIVNNPIDNGKQYMGIPDDEFDTCNTLPGWEYRVRDYLAINDSFPYEYDFGNGWEHLIQYEGVREKTPGIKYPLCIDGERACPPEDVGGPHGFDHFLEIITNKGHPEYRSYLEWVGGKYDPGKFNPKKVKFDNPSKRWKAAFGDH